MTLQEFDKWLVQRIVEYHATTHSSLGEPPLQRLRTGLEQHPLPPAAKDLKSYLIDFLPLYRRQIRRDGFHLDRITYYDPKLDYYIARHKSDRQHFELRRDPRNLRFIWMRLPDAPGYMEIPYRRLTHPDISLWEHRQAITALREANARLVDEDLIMRAVKDRREMVRKAGFATKRARRDEERRKHPGPLAGSALPEIPSAPQPKRDKPLEPFEAEVEW